MQFAVHSRSCAVYQLWDGIVGLSYPNTASSGDADAESSPAASQPLFDTIIKQKVLSSRGLANQFAYFIDDTKGLVGCLLVCQAVCHLCNPPGSLTFGGANCALLGAQHEYACVVFSRPSC